MARGLKWYGERRCAPRPITAFEHAALGHSRWVPPVARRDGGLALGVGMPGVDAGDDDTCCVGGRRSDADRPRGTRRPGATTLEADRGAGLAVREPRAQAGR